MEINTAIDLLNGFMQDDLTGRIRSLEKVLIHKTNEQVSAFLHAQTIQPEMLCAALLIKRIAGQINVSIHSLGILLSLPYILDKNETIEALSLGAGNTGKPFDLVTDCRVAEFKFSNWQGADQNREGELFKDFFRLAEAPTPKRKFLYVLGDKLPLNFLNGGKDISSVLKNKKPILENLHQIYGQKLLEVRDYYLLHSEKVKLVDLLKVYPPEISAFFFE